MAKCVFLFVELCGLKPCQFMRMGLCDIKISGGSFGVVEFLKSSNIKPHVIWRRGEISSIEKGPCLDSGFQFVISDDANKPLSFHLKEATRFLAVQEPELIRASRFGASDLRLAIGLNHAESAAEYLPPKLLLLAGRLDIGIEISWVAGISEPNPTPNSKLLSS